MVDVGGLLSFRLLGYQYEHEHVLVKWGAN